MAYELITNRSIETGLEQVFYYVNDVTSGLFINLMLVSIYLVFTLSIYFNEKRVGRESFPMATTVGAFATFIVATLLRLIPNLLSLSSYTIVIVVLVFSVMWLLFKD